MSSRWTSKIISKASKLARKDSSSSVDNPNVNDFLYGSSGPPPPQNDAILPSQPPTPPRSQPPPAALDLDDNDNGLGEPVPPANPTYSLRPIRRQKGLRVNFTAERPVLIGEGGDEAMLPTSEVMKHAHALAPLPTRMGEPPAIVEPGGSAGRVDLATDQKAVGIGFLQKRRSFNMEEGMIQSQRQVSNSSPVPRQAFGASLDPSSAYQTLPPAVPPPPPSAQMDNIQQREQQSLPQALRAASGNADSPRSESVESPKSPSARQWDSLQTRASPANRPSNPTVPQISPSQLASMQMNPPPADLHQVAHLSQTGYTRPPPPPPVVSPQMAPTQATLPPSSSFTHMSQPRPAPLPQFKPRPALVPQTSQGPEKPPSDAFAGGVTSFPRGSSPKEASHIPYQPTATSPPNGAQPSSPTESVHSVGSSLASAIDSLWAPSQEISLSDQWGLGGVYRPATLRSPANSPPMQSAPMQGPPGTLPQSPASQQFARPFNRSAHPSVPQPSVPEPAAPQQPRPATNIQHSQTPSLTREPTLPVLPPTGQSVATAIGALDNRRPTLPNVSSIRNPPVDGELASPLREPTLPVILSPNQPAAAMIRRPSAEPNQERPSMFEPKTGHDPPLSPNVAQVQPPPLDGSGRLQTNVSPPVLSQPSPGQRKEDGNNVSNGAVARSKVLGMASNINSMTKAQISPTVKQRSEAFKPVPNAGPSVESLRDQPPPRKSSKDPLNLGYESSAAVVAAAAAAAAASRNPSLPPTRSGSTSVSDPAESHVSSKTGLQAGTKAPSDTVPAPAPAPAPSLVPPPASAPSAAPAAPAAPASAPAPAPPAPAPAPAPALVSSAPTPPAIPPHVQPVRSSQVSQPPVPQLPPVSSRTSMVGTGDQRIHEAPRVSAVDDYKYCIEALAPAFMKAEQQARTVVRPKAFLWLRVASWWSLRGRKGFEGKIKEQLETGGSQSAHVDETLLQPFVDASKAWWVVERILPEIMGAMLPQSPSEPGGLHGMALQQVFQALRVQLETFVSSVTRRRLVPSPELLTSKLHTGFLVDYPSLPTVVRTATAGYSPSVAIPGSNSPPFFSMVLADDESHFSYGHLFADAQIELPGDDDDSDEEEDLVLPCIVSLFRERHSSQLEMTVTSQDGQVDLHIKADNGNRPSWRNAEMRTKSHSIKMELVQDFNLVIRFEKDDFKTLWGMREYNQLVLNEWNPEPDERVIFAAQLHDLNYLPAQGQPSPLPTNPIKGCAMRLYERRSVDSQETGTAVFSGHRIVVMTAPEVKTLSHISHIYDGNFPILHKYLRGDAQRPALMMHFLDRGKPASMIPSFMDDDDRIRFIDKLSGSYVASDEQVIDAIPVANVTVSTSVPGTPANLLDIPGIQWQDINIIVKGADPDPFESGRFRITAHCKAGSLVDRPSIQPGEMKIGLDMLDMNSIRLRRSIDSSLTLSLMENSLPPGLTHPLQDAFAKKATAPSTIRYQFTSLQDLHKFQRLVTKYEVLYDGVCNAFSIKGQRTVGGLNKRMEATKARLQIVKDRSGLQLLAFFKDMPDGACMSFGVGSTDVYELSSANSKSYLRFIDARFGVPKPLSESDATFVSLDLPEFAGERDDILIGFDKEEDRSAFVSVLPGSPAKASGLTTLKRLVEQGRPSSRSRNY